MALLPAPGLLVGRDFRLERRLSAGGMGEVFLATQLSTGARRAVKLMRAELQLDARLRERFEQEARLGASIPSDHVAQVVAAGVDDALAMPFLAMEYLEGAELGEVVTQLGGLTLGELDSVLRQLCHALGAAHAMGIVHRDVKPSNVFLTRSRSADSPVMLKVLDFGIAKLLADAGTRSTQAMGTPLWVSPEQTEKRASVTPATDVWALGLVAFHALTGRLYWASAQDGDDASLAAVMREVLVDPLEAASVRAQGLGASIPDALDAWFSRCIARRPDERFANASLAYEAFAAAIAPLLAASARPDRGPAALVRALDAVAEKARAESVEPIPEPAAAPMAEPPSAPTRFEAPALLDAPSAPSSASAARVTESRTVAAPGVRTELALPESPLSDAPRVAALPSPEPAPPRKRWRKILAVVGALVVASVALFAGERASSNRCFDESTNCMRALERWGNECVDACQSIPGAGDAMDECVLGCLGPSFQPGLCSEAYESCDTWWSLNFWSKPVTTPSGHPRVTPPSGALTANAELGLPPEGMVRIAGGTFKLGNRGDTVTLADYWLDVTEVTADAYAACAKAGRCTGDGLSSGGTYQVSGKGNHPITSVDWTQAGAYCRWKSKRLPTEPEWEWAARGGFRGTEYPWGNDRPSGRVCSSPTCPVGSFPSGDSPEGVKDLAGNVLEWTYGYFGQYSSQVERVTRGGRDGFGAADRGYGVYSTSHSSDVGFRCAKSALGTVPPTSVAPSTGSSASATGSASGGSGSPVVP